MEEITGENAVCEKLREMLKLECALSIEEWDWLESKLKLIFEDDIDLNMLSQMKSAIATIVQKGHNKKTGEDTTATTVDTMLTLQLFQSLALLCRKEKYRSFAQKESFHELIDEYFQSIKKDLSSMITSCSSSSSSSVHNGATDGSTVGDGLANQIQPPPPQVLLWCAVIRCLANLAYEYPTIQLYLQHNIHILTQIILSPVSYLQLVSVSCGCLQNLLFESQSEEAVNAVERKDHSTSSESLLRACFSSGIVSHLIKQITNNTNELKLNKGEEDKLLVCENLEVVNANMFNLLSRLFDFKLPRSELIGSSFNIGWVMSQLKDWLNDGVGPVNGVEEEGGGGEGGADCDDSNLCIDDNSVMILMSTLECILMEDETGHEKLFNEGILDIVERMLSESHEEQLLSSSCNIAVGLSMHKNVANSMLKEGEQPNSTTEKMLDKMYCYDSIVYVKASSCLLVGNLAFDESSVEKCYQLNYLHRYVIPILLSLYSVQYERGSEAEKQHLIMKSSALVSLKNFLVCQSTRKSLSEDSQVVDALVKCVLETPPMDTKNFYQVTQNMRLIVQSNSALCCQLLLHNEALMQKLIETSKDVPIDHIRNECNRLMATLVTNTENVGLLLARKGEESGQSNWPLLDPTAESVSKMMLHGSYVMLSESVVALVVLCSLHRFGLSFPVIKLIVENIIAALKTNLGIAEQNKQPNDVSSRLSGINLQLLQLLKQLLEVTPSDNLAEIKLFLNDNLVQSKPHSELLTSDHVTQHLANEIFSKMSNN